MSENIKKKIINWGVSGSMLLSTALYSSMSFAYRLDKNMEISSVNYNFMTNALLDIINIENESIDYKYKIESNDYSYSFFDSNKDQQVVLYNSEDHNALFKESNIVKKGDCESVYNSGVLGANSAILSLGDLSFYKGNIKTFGKGAKGFYQKGKDKTGLIVGTKIETYKDNSNAVEVADEGNLIIKKSLIYTAGENSGGICISANSKGRIENSDVFIINDNSPALYINGELVIKNSLVQTESSYIAVIEGMSDVFFINTSLRGRQGFKMMNKSVENGFKIKLGITNRYVSIEEGFMFDIENVSADINLSKVDITLKEKKFIKAKSNKYNGEQLNNTVVNLNKTMLSGDIIIDDNNTIDLFFYDNVRMTSTMKGKINLHFTEDNYDQLILSNDSYVDQIQISDNNIATLKRVINLNGYTLYYKQEFNSWLENRSFYFEDGSSLIAI